MRPKLCLLLICLASVGCSRSAVVKYWEPSGIPLNDLHRVAVLDFGGENGGALAGTLTEQLRVNKFSLLVDRAELEDDVQTAAFSTSGEREPLLAVLKVARERGIDGLLLGDVEDYRCEDRVVRRTDVRLLGRGEQDDYSYRVFGAGINLTNSEKLVRDATVTINVRLMDVDTGDVRASRRITHSAHLERTDSQAEFPEPQTTLRQLTQTCLDELVNLLVPHAADAELALAQGEPWTRQRSTIRRGVMHAEAGNWNAARRDWEAALSADPASHAALFNLAAAAAQEQDYVTAEDLAMQALRIQYRNAYVAGLDVIRQRRNADESLRKQSAAVLPELAVEASDRAE